MSWLSKILHVVQPAERIGAFHGRVEAVRDRCDGVLNGAEDAECGRAALTAVRELADATDALMRL